MIPSYYVYPGLPENLEIKKMIKYNGQMSIPDVVRLVCEHFAISEVVMYSRFKGNRYICDARKVICYLSHIILKRTFMDIGQVLNRDHTTIVHALKTTQDLLQTDENFAKDLYYLTSKIVR